MFSETRYAMNGDLRVAYRASREGPRDLVFVSNWFTNCGVFPELPSIQGWTEAMTSLGARLAAHRRMRDTRRRHRWHRRPHRCSVSALAGPNEVLVSSTLRDLVIGSGLEFDDRGAHQLKGVRGAWSLYAVAST